MRLTSKGQVTIPKPIRDELGLLPGIAVEFTVEGDTVVLRRATRGHMRRDDIRAHLRAHSGDIKMTTEEIMALTRGEER